MFKVFVSGENAMFSSESVHARLHIQINLIILYGKVSEYTRKSYGMFVS